MRTECRRSLGGATASGNANDLWAFARLSFLLAVFAGMVAFPATKHSDDTAALKSPVIRPT
jgi:hypothetical protein